MICALAWFACGGAAPAVGGDAAGQTGRVSDERRVRAIPADVPITRHYVNPATGEQHLFAGGLTDENLVYSNTPPPNMYLALDLPDIAVADDIRTVALGGCGMTAYEVMVSGGGDGSGPGFSATLAMFDACPHGGGQVIPGTEAVVPLEDDGLHAIVVDLSASPISVDQSSWISVTVDSPSAGWVTGTRADIGFTAPVFDFELSPPCGARHSFETLYEGFHARIWCEPFETEFPAYVNNNLNGLLFQLGAGQWLMDDVALIVDDCVLSSYEIGAVASGGGEVTVTAELRSLCGSPNTIEGTQGTAQFVADDVPVFARVEFPGGVDLGGRQRMWMAFNFDAPTGAIVSGEAMLGYTDDLFGLANGEGCDFFYFAAGLYSGFAINIYCLGSPPVGACCDMSNPPGERCRETTAFSCNADGRQRRLSQGRTCDDPEAFDPPCGAGACCTPPEGRHSEDCSNLTQEVCEAIVDDEGNPAYWDQAHWCGDLGQHCWNWPCRYADGPCDVAHDTPGCMSTYCCGSVCHADPYCCDVEWDWNCVRNANEDHCTGAGTPVSYDACWSDEPYYGAVAVGANSRVYLWNDRADSDDTEGFCCNPSGVGAPGAGAIWAKLTATHTTARIDTCGTIDADAGDSLLQLMRASDHSSEQAACESLTAIACNDDRDCGNQAVICADNLVPGETYYILLASRSWSDRGEYVLSVTSPAPPECADPGGEPFCPAGYFHWIDPPSGVVDARQPHELYDAGALRGIDQITVEGPVGTDPACWTVCNEGRANAVVSVEPGPNCASTLHLEHPITGGAVTQIVYAGSPGHASFTSHPGNVDANEATDADDIIALIDMINEVRWPPYELYSCDIDHSGACDPPDIIRLIDMLNGAGAFTPWFGTPLPTTTGDCP